ncbi:HlyD family efflux transporter periplasmic adaptor subunit [Lignipirellula cremea]|uniref:HlyD family secretion protein n=1 Tax=Lignipirellula cremea TaxID=2528010 RepID=A0A518E0F6_9BACT|nr:HlyD family efflux transporter periplasmic adaptor subunit [Lignipirellula cremea]QDU97572.1 HlyD family secretion protein [Lignipirellula cremea]
MATAQDTANARPLGLRIRPDLATRALEFRGRRSWGVKDPVSLRYFQFREEEYFLIRQLDGTVGMDELQERFERRFAPRKLHPEQLLNFIGSLHSQGLIVADLPGQAEELLKRRDQQRWRDRFERVAGVLAIRFRGIDPDRMLGWLEPRMRWLFSWPVLVMAALLVGSALLLATLEFSTLRDRLPDFATFFSAKNAVYLAVALALTKILHELGHGLVCKHYHGECHELGLMLLVFTPCLYVNVTDAWLIRSRWQRAAIGAAGMAVELVLASLCLFLWWASEPGLLHGLFLNVVFICSVSTLLFNGNPLLRYDGYFILSDLIETPNLHQQSQAVVTHYLGRWFLGIEEANERSLPESGRGWLALFWVASLLYRLFVLWMIAWVLHAALKPYGLEALVQLMVLVSLGGMLAGPAQKTFTFLRHPGRMRDVKRLRFLILTSLLAGAVAAVLLVPLPYRVPATAMAELQGARRVYVTTPGAVTAQVQPGDTVQQGDVLARLEDLEIERQLTNLQGLAAEKQVKLDHLEKRRIVEQRSQTGAPAEADRLIRDVAQELAAIARQIAEQEKLREHLTITAPAAGVVLPQRPRREPPGAAGDLPPWSGSPLDPANTGALLETGDELCLIGDPAALEALLLIDQADIQFVRLQQRVRLRFHQTPGETLWGRIVEIAEVDLEELPAELIASGELPTVADKRGNPQLVSAAYQARVLFEKPALDERAAPLRLRSVGIARIHADPQSLWQRAARYLARTFRFEW